MLSTLRICDVFDAAYLRFRARFRPLGERLKVRLYRVRWLRSFSERRRRQECQPPFQVEIFDDLLNMGIYPPQTKILENGTKRCVCVFERMFNDASPKSSTTHARKKVFKNAHATLCSVFQNLRLGSIRLSQKRGGVAYV
jgi:hypothetical protein